MFMLLVLLSSSTYAQQQYNTKQMVFVPTNKPNTIIYNDTIYKGSKQFKTLFLRTGDKDLAKLYQQHQSNKIAGGIIGTLGSVAMIIGVSQATSSSNNKTGGWIAVGSGLAATIVGGYLVLIGQQKIAIATEFFNRRYATTTAGIGFTGNGIGLVVTF
jgi:hypothetical protein